MGKYDAWDAFFAGVEGDEVTLTFAELEDALGSSLPPSARRYQEWWASTHYYAKWTNHGLVASPDMTNEKVRFRRGTVRRGRPAASRPAPAGVQPGVGRQSGKVGRRMILLGCVSGTQDVAAPAQELYVSPLWERRRRYAESTGESWVILSAEHGMLLPNEVIAPYDQSLRDESAEYRRTWSERTARAVIDMCRQLELENVECHAGAPYLENGLISELNAAGIRVLWPLRGMRIGEQLSWYDTQAAGLDQAGGEVVESPSAINTWEEQGVVVIPKILQMEAIGPFEFQWPDSTELFDYGWEGQADLGGRRVRFRHGVGGRIVYGADRVHTVTWLGNVIVEGVAADDFEQSRALLSLIKTADGSMVRNMAEVDGRYRSLPVVDHRGEIDAKWSRSGMAVKIRVDDLAGWLLHAWLRGGGSAHGGAPSPRISPDADPAFSSGPSVIVTGAPADESEVAVDTEAPSSLGPMSAEHKHGVAQALVAFTPRAAELTGDLEGSKFAAIPEANQLLVDDPFAFLLAVIADYQIAAEKAWALPYLLKQRLGHLDMERMLADPQAVAEAVARRPSLHRYINNVASYFVEACRIVLGSYGGDASQIWADEPTAVEVQRRLQRFPGISQKKAAMAVEILERDFGVPIRNMEGSDIAFDVHIRRVFLRSGLAEIDDQDHMIKMARRYWPDRPGLLDLPSWVIGRNWCRPRDPGCTECPIGLQCARRVAAASAVRGA